MTSDRTTRLTVFGAVALSSLALTSLGCGRTDDVTAEKARALAKVQNTQSEGARMPTPPLAEDPAPTTVPTVQRVVAEREKPAAAPAAAGEGKTSQATVAAPTGVASGVSVKRLVMTNAIEGREPAQFTAFRSDGGQVVAFIEAQNEAEASQKIIVTFEHASGAKVGFVKLEIPENSTRWRTWARSSHITKPGEWTAVVRTSEGDELARQAFSVEG